MRPNLNLLIVFDAIMSERNLRLAADRLGRSQPSISQSVARLHDTLGNRLLEMTPNGMEPTQRAEAAWQGTTVLRFQSRGVAKTGLHYDGAYCFAMVMRDGRITEIVAYLDTDLLVRIFS